MVIRLQVRTFIYQFIFQQWKTGAENEVWGSCSDDYEDNCHLGCDTISLVDSYIMEEHGACVFRVEELNCHNLYMEAHFPPKFHVPEDFYL
jgi:hypothetical protein